MLLNHLPILQVILPLMAAPLCLIVRQRHAVFAITVLVSWLCFAMAILQVGMLDTQGVITYHIGNWAPPWGIEFRLDLLAGLMLLIVTMIGAFVSVYSWYSARSEVPRGKLYLFYVAFLLCLAGLLGMISTGDAFNLFVFLEISSLATYAMIALSRDKRALMAAFRYLILGTLGATFYVIAVGFLYMSTGTLNMADLAEFLPNLTDMTSIRVALAFLTVGLSLKLALFPLHSWLPNAYTYAPSAVTAFLASTATKVAIYAMLRMFFTVFGKVDVFEQMHLGTVLMAFSIMGMIVASAMAVGQKNVKRLFAYSSVAQIGYIVLGISLASTAGISAGIIHLFNHALIKCTLFMALGAVVLRNGSVRLEDMAGIGRRLPWTMSAVVAGGLALIGVPGTVGFVTKWQLMEAAMEQNMIAVAFVIPASSLLAVVYVWKVIEVAWFKEAPEDAPPLRKAPFMMLLPIWTLIFATIWFGFRSEGIVQIAKRATLSLLNGGAV